MFHLFTIMLPDIVKMKPLKRLGKYILWISLLFITGFLIAIGVFTYSYFSSDLISPDRIMNRNNTGITLLDDQGQAYWTFYQAKYRQEVDLSHISKVTQYAIIASEDKDFYTHPGFSAKAILRSLFADLEAQKVVSGGSTITQQLVKYSLLEPQQSFLRKYQEIILAQSIEAKFSKQQILQMYLNSAYFGEGAFGIEEAAQTYFAKNSSNLDLAESAFLTGLLPAPSTLSPFSGNLKEAQVHQRIVLEKMSEQGYISKQDEKTATTEQLNFNSSPESLNTIAPDFALMVRDQLVQQFGEEEIARSGFTVTTTLNLNWEKYTQQVLQNQVQNLRGDGATNGAVVVEDPTTGQIKALVGSVDWNNPYFGKINMAISPRQPGSSFKPIYYSAALEEHVITPATILQDRPTTFGTNYHPRDYDGKYRGPVTVRRALANSLNIPSVEVMQMLGVPNAIEMADRLGITTLQDPSYYGLALALGAGEVKLTEMTNVYATFANQGLENSPTIISSIIDKSGNSVYWPTPLPQQVLDPGVAFLISSILSDNKTRSEEFGNALTISRPAAVKTGTTEDFRDAWTLGYTPSLTIGVWVGNDNNIPMDNVAGSLGAAPIWRDLMETFLASTPVEQFNPPSGVTKVICSTATTKTASASASEYFLEDNVPARYCLLSPTTTPSISPTISPP